MSLKVPSARRRTACGLVRSLSTQGVGRICGPTVSRARSKTVFQLQDDIALSVAGVIEPALQAAETACAAARPTIDLTAYDLYLRAYAKHLSAGPQSGGALRLLEQAIERDPNYGPALALAAVCRGRLYIRGRSEDLEEDGRKAVVFA